MGVTIERKTSKSHWYRMYLGECPVCGRDKSYRERVYGAKPVRRIKRTVYLSDYVTYDHCDGI